VTCGDRNCYLCPPALKPQASRIEPAKPVVIDFPTYTQVLEVTTGKTVTVTARAESGERATVTGLLHSTESGRREVGPYLIAYMKPRRRFSSSDPVQLDPFVPVEIIALEVHA